ncbi:MAG: hypothetical protein Q7R83_02545, partial [bacterium]|nr:hypothetical protein [bacterium]
MHGAPRAGRPRSLERPVTPPRQAGRAGPSPSPHRTMGAVPPFSAFALGLGTIPNDTRSGGRARSLNGSERSRELAGSIPLDLNA